MRGCSIRKCSTSLVLCADRFLKLGETASRSFNDCGRSYSRGNQGNRRLRPFLLGRQNPNVLWYEFLTDVIRHWRSPPCSGAKTKESAPAGCCQSIPPC